MGAEVDVFFVNLRSSVSVHLLIHHASAGRLARVSSASRLLLCINIPINKIMPDCEIARNEFKFSRATGYVAIVQASKETIT